MALAISNEDTNILLKDKNVLNEPVLDKYRIAGQITQTAITYLKNLINDSYHYKTINPPLSISQLCFLTDLFISQTLETFYKNKVNERGISHPCAIDVDEFNNGWSPELDDFPLLTNKNKSSDYTNGMHSAINNVLKDGDLVKITLGCHIDGYTSQVTHSMCIYPTIENNTKPQGPLLGGKADAIAASHIATETIVSLLACSLHPEKLPQAFHSLSQSQINGTLMRSVVDTIAQSYNCCVVPGSKIRRIRRFLAGQNEGVVAERDFKGVVWYESNQEADLLNKSKSFSENSNDNNEQESALVASTNSKNSHNFLEDSAIAKDDFQVLPGEVYLIDLKFAPLTGETGNKLGLVTLESLNEFSGSTTTNRNITIRNSQFVRDYTQTHILKLKTSRAVLNKLDKQGVYPVKLAHLSDDFLTCTPQDVIANNLQNINKDLKSIRLGMNEITNNYLATSKPVQIVKFIPWDLILNCANPSGNKGTDAINPTLPGFEVPLPKLNISSLKLKSLLKNKECVTLPMARESCVVAVSELEDGAIRLTGGSKTCAPIWCHSQYQLDPNNNITQGIFQLTELSKDERFGLKIREVQPMKKVLQKTKQSVGADADSMMN
ncbi:hypothetical protein ACO0QE_002799 [Hanseniaspora vineae]